MAFKVLVGCLVVYCLFCIYMIRQCADTVTVTVVEKEVTEVIVGGKVFTIIERY